MADDKQQQDKTEEATPKRIEDARKKGDVPRSKELSTSLVMISGASGLLLLGGGVGSELLRGISDSLSIERQQIFDVNHMPAAFAAMATNTLLALLPFGLILIIASFAGAALVGGWSFSLQAISFKAGKLNPLKGIKKIFSTNSINELFKSLAKFVLVAVAAGNWLFYNADELLGLGRQPIIPAISTALRICGMSLLVVSSTLILIALADVPFQISNYNKKLKMTRQEVRDEHKDTEGRPEVKARIRSLQQQIANRRMMEEIPGADVVVTNPTHYAVALKYDEAKPGAPRVVAKGKGLIAANIRDQADACNVPRFSAPPLARALYSSTKLGQEIPAGLYTVVAQVLAYIFQIRDMAGSAPHISKPILPDIDEALYS
jgi:flagellar biosynthetic protein FlhB